MTADGHDPGPEPSPEAPEAALAGPAVLVPLRRTPPTRRLSHAALLLFLGILPAVVLPVGWFWWQRLLTTTAAAAALILVSMAGLGWLVWLFALPKPAPITVDDDWLDLPLGRQRLRFALTELLVLRLDHDNVILFAAPSPQQAVRGHAGGAAIPRRCFADADGPVHLVAAIRQRLRTRHGAGYLDRLDDNERRQLAFHRRRPVVVWSVTALCVLAFGIEMLTGAMESGGGLIRLGANASDLVGAGQVWRVVTANLLHGSLIHLGMNLAALMSTGALVERWLGRPATGMVLFAAGAGGQLTSALMALLAGTPRISVGISGAIFGILGVLLVSSVRFWRSPTGGLRLPISTWVLLLVTNAAISTIPIVDIAAHVGGFVVGVGVALVASPRPGGQAAVLSPPALRWAAIAALATTAVAVVVMLVSLAFQG